MAIQNRRGAYADFDPSRLVEGEWAVVQSGDPNSASGRSVYMAFEPGVVTRMATYEDMEDNIDAATESIQQQFTAGVQTAITNANNAKDAANAAATYANTQASRADDAADRVEGLLGGNVSFVYKTVSGGTDRTFSIPANARIMIFVNGPAAAVRGGFYFISTSNAGVLSSTSVANLSDVTISQTTAYTIKISNTASNTAAILFLAFTDAGNIS